MPTSGSIRKNASMASSNGLALRSRVCRRTDKWVTPGTWYSTGSSMAMILRWLCAAKRWSKLLKVVVLPEPVMPATNTPPHDEPMASLMRSICHAV